MCHNVHPFQLALVRLHEIIVEPVSLQKASTVEHGLT